MFSSWKSRLSATFSKARNGKHDPVKEQGQLSDQETHKPGIFKVLSSETFSLGSDLPRRVKRAELFILVKAVPPFSCISATNVALGRTPKKPLGFSQAV